MHGGFLVALMHIMHQMMLACFLAHCLSFHMKSVCISFFHLKYLGSLSLRIDIRVVFVDTQ